MLSQIPRLHDCFIKPGEQEFDQCGQSGVQVGFKRQGRAKNHKLNGNTKRTQKVSTTVPTRCKIDWQVKHYFDMIYISWRLFTAPSWIPTLGLGSFHLPPSLQKGTKNNKIWGHVNKCNYCKSSDFFLAIITPSGSCQQRSKSLKNNSNFKTVPAVLQMGKRFMNMSSSFTMSNKVNLFKPFTKHLFELQRSDKWTRKLDRIETQQGDVQA